MGKVSITKMVGKYFLELDELHPLIGNRIKYHILVEDTNKGSIGVLKYSQSYKAASAYFDKLDTEKKIEKEMEKG